ncbi:MAG: helix-turn-helix transcriptional regulator [Pseudomonadota bacterium]
MPPPEVGCAEARAVLEERSCALGPAAITFPVMTPYSDVIPTAGLNAYSSLRGRNLKSQLPRLGEQGAALAHLVNEHIVPRLRLQTDRIKPLSVREAECLSFAAAGLRVKQIADRLSLSDRTVEFHLNGARRKLKANSLPHAVARAIHYGQIQP